MKALQVYKFTFNNYFMMNRELNFSVARNDFGYVLICWVTLSLRVRYWGQVVEMNFCSINLISCWRFLVPRGGSRAAATSKMEHFVIIINGLQSLTNITKRSILNVAAALISASASPASWVTYNEDVLPMYWHTGMYFSEYKIWESLKHSLK